MSIYRDPGGALVGQVTAKRAVLVERAARLPPILRAIAPPATRALLRDRSLLDGPVPTDLEALRLLDDRLEAALAAHDEVETRAWLLRRCPHDVPDFSKPHLPPPYLIEEPPVLGFRFALARRLAAVSPGTDVVRWGDFAYVARFTVAGAPLVVLARAKSDPNIDLGARVEVRLRTSLPETFPSLELRPEGLRHAVGKALGLLHERSVDEPRLDAAYVVEGDEDALAVLTPDVRQALLAFRVRAPSLVVGGGVAEVSWSGPWRGGEDVALPAEAVAIACGVRRAVDG